MGDCPKLTCHTKLVLHTVREKPVKHYRFYEATGHAGRLKEIPYTLDLGYKDLNLGVVWKLSKVEKAPFVAQMLDGSTVESPYLYKFSRDGDPSKSQFAMPEVRRRLANQSLIDRFIRESERCIHS